MEETPNVEMLASSRLGTQDYWEQLYQKENKNFSENGDEGEVWFGEDAMYRMVRFVDQMAKDDTIEYSSSIIDLGTGNGELDEYGFTSLTGVDYAIGSVNLARQICSELTSVTLHQANLLQLDSKFFNKFNLAVDKGTFDAISLTPEDKLDAIRSYTNNVAQLLKHEIDSFLLITSCNWTIDELKSHFGSSFSHVKTIPVSTFQFGGKSGSTTSTALFKRKMVFASTDTILQNATPTLFGRASARLDSQTDWNEAVCDAFDSREVFDLIRDIRDPEHPMSLEELGVVQEELISVDDGLNTIEITFTPTIPHCSMATLIGLSIRVKLIRSLPSRFKVDVRITPGSHSQEGQINRQLEDKERVAAALENGNLIRVVNQALRRSLEEH